MRDSSVVYPSAVAGMAALSATRRVLILFGMLVAYTLFFYRDILFEQRVNVFRDQYTILMAVDYIVRLLSRWEWPPLWTPFQALGKPLAAEPLTAVLYPPNWLLRLLPFPLGYNASVAFHHVVAASGLYALLRHRRLEPLAAALGALLFGFGGLLVAFDNMSNALQSATWMPWTLLAFDVWCARRTLGALAGTAAGLALTLLGGMPEAFFFEHALFAVIAIDRRWNGGGPPLARAAVAVLAADALAFGFAAVQLLPTLEYLTHSSRAGGLRLDAVMRLSLRPLGVFAFLLPRHYLDPSGHFHETAALWEGELSGAPWAVTLYLGPVLVLAAAGATELGRARRWWWLAVGALFLALACGEHTPGYAWLLAHAPFLRIARYPEKFLLVVHGLLAAAAAVGLHGALREPAHFRRVAIAAVVLSAGMGLAAAALLLRPSFVHALLVGDLAGGASVLLGIAALAVVGRTRPTAIGLAFLALAAVDLYRVNGQLLPTVAWSDLRRPPATLAVMQRGEDPLRIYSDGLGRPAVPAFPDAFLQEQTLLLMEVANYHAVANLNGPSSINLRDHELLAQLTESVPRERVASLFALLNTAYVTSAKDLYRYPGLTLLRPPASPTDAYVYRVDGLVPRAFVARRVRPVAGEAEAIEHFRSGNAPALTVAVASDAIPDGLPAEMSGTVRLSLYQAHRVELDASLPAPGLVVLSDSFYPGWKASVDGAPAPIVRANHFARGVFVPAGEHRIVFHYRPWSYRIGSWISAAAVVTTLAAMLVVRRSHRGLI